MEEKKVKKRKKLSKKEEKRRKLLKSLRNKRYYANRKRKKALEQGIILPPESEVVKTKPRKTKKTTRKTKKVVKKVVDGEVKKEKRDTFLVVITSHKKVLTEVGLFRKKEYALNKYNEIIEESENKVAFPVKYIVYKRIGRGLTPSNYEVLLLKARRETDTNTKLRNEYGQYVDHVVVDNNNWVIIDKHPYNKEESFWVYGFNPRTQRKDFNFILNEIILVNDDKNYFKRIIIFKNKLIIQYDFDIDLVVCKNSEDSIRLYNALEKAVKKAKYKNIFFNGIVSNSNKEWAINLIMEKTGWKRDKIKRSDTEN